MVVNVIMEMGNGTCKCVRDLELGAGENRGKKGWGSCIWERLELRLLGLSEVKLLDVPDRRQETGGRRQEAGGRRQEARKMALSVIVQ